MDQSSRQDSRQIDATFNNTGLNQRSRDELFVCLWPACNATCRRIYDLKRHYTAVHNRKEVGYFCPVVGCGWSELPSNVFHLRYGYDSYGAVTLHSTAATIIIALQGFARKDKLLRHLKREHKDKFGGDHDAPPEDCKPRGQILVELKRFKGYKYLGRVQHDDGTWGNWYGRHYDDVAAGGFQTDDGSPFDPESTVGPDVSALLDAQRNSSVAQLASPFSSPSTSEGQSTSADGESAPPPASAIDPSALNEAQVWRGYEAYTGHSSFNHYENMGSGPYLSNGSF